MHKINIFLLGSHSKRTPFAYSGYKPFFDRFFRYVDSHLKADVIILGYVATFETEKGIIIEAINNNPSVKFAVCSEEPLWETTGLHISRSSDIVEATNTSACYKLDDILIEFLYLSHHNALKCEGNLLPYYITTNDRFYIRYNQMFTRNYLSLTSNSVSNLWKCRATRFATFIFEKRDNKNKYDFCIKNIELRGLSFYRSSLVSLLLERQYEPPGCLAVGAGWGPELSIRQSLHDWHLDKITICDKKTFLMSAIENTLHPNYVTEKIFDAYACQSLPIYIASDKHIVKKFLPNCSFVNLYSGLESISESVDLLILFREKSFSSDLIDAYIIDQFSLYALFRSADLFLESRQKYADSVTKYLLSYVD